jgi:hypothetical protein
MTGPALAAGSLDPRDSVIYPPEHARVLLQQCSRGTPTGVERTWMPAKRQVAELEDLLPAALATALQEHSRDPKHVRDYLRQLPNLSREYGGFVVHGRKIIYLSAALLGPHRTVRPDYTRHIAVCDGGDTFFGVEYDPSTRAFSNFQFNGIA